MKLKHALSLLSLATCAALSTSAFAQTTVTFTGTITDSVCTTAVAGNNNTVKLPQQSKSDFTNGGGVNATAGSTKFDVVLSGCVPAVATYRINFSDPSADANGYLPNATGASTGYGFVLFDANDTNPIKFTTAAANTSGPFDPNDPGVTGTNGAATLSYYARYIQLSANPTAGTVESTATMTVQYQ